jgi:hypothetical protein
MGLWPVLLTAPCALFVAIFYWRRPTSITRRYKWRFVVAIVLALLEVVFLGMVLVSLFWAFRQRFQPR